MVALSNSIFAVQNYTILTSKASMVALSNSIFAVQNYTILAPKALMIALSNNKYWQYKTTLSLLLKH